MTKDLHNAKTWSVSRRDFLRRSGGLIALGISAPSLFASTSRPQNLQFRFGMLTDLHYAERDPWTTRFYRQSLEKMRSCVRFMNTQELEFLVELGDLKDESTEPSEAETLTFLRDIEAAFAGFSGPRYHVLGNHDIDSISKDQFQENVQNTGISRERTWYSFNRGGLHFVTLDANFRKDGIPYDRGNFSWRDPNIPSSELEWLRRDLEENTLPTIVFCHQLLTDASPHCVINAAEVRSILESSGNVLAAFHGHKHEGDYAFINGIHYYTLEAVVEGSGPENSAYAVVEVLRDHSLVVTGYLNARSGELAPAAEND
ncbi:MAG: metallophosphoesterase [Oceanipulchritudo sp.]